MQSCAISDKLCVVHGECLLQLVKLIPFERVREIAAKSPSLADAGQLPKALADSLIQPSDASHQILTLVELLKIAHAFAQLQGDIWVLDLEFHLVAVDLESDWLRVGGQDDRSRGMIIRRFTILKRFEKKVAVSIGVGWALVSAGRG